MGHAEDNRSPPRTQPELNTAMLVGLQSKHWVNFVSFSRLKTLGQERKEMRRKAGKKKKKNQSHRI